MIMSCKYCLRQTHLCPRCEGPVVTRTITEQVPVLGYVSCSVILCLTPNCQDYGRFKLQTELSVITTICKECADRAENLKRFQSDLENTFGRRIT